MSAPSPAPVPTRNELERAVPHENHCDRYGIHCDCCPGRADYGCTCLVATVLDIWIAGGWLTEPIADANHGVCTGEINLPTAEVGSDEPF